MREIALVVAFACACKASGESPTSASAGAGAGGVAPTAGVGASEAGLGVWACPPGSRQLADKSCKPAGIAATECGDGFVHDGKDGCEPVLPKSACPQGQLAIPGESECHLPAPCGAGKWAGIVVDGDTQYVDVSFSGASDGTIDKPWTKIQQAVEKAKPGAVVAIAPGSYPEKLFIEKPLTLWGKCPSEVEIVGATPLPAAITYAKGSAGSVLRRVAVRGQDRGIATAGATALELDEAWVHDTADVGIYASSDGKPAKLTVRNSLIENATDTGIYAIGGTVIVERSVVRDTKLLMGSLGRGIDIDASFQPGTLVIERSLIERVLDVGVGVHGCSGTITNSVIRDVSKSDGAIGPCVLSNASSGSPSFGATLSIGGSLCERCVEFGVVGQSSIVTVVRTVVRSIQHEKLTALLAILPEPNKSLPIGATLRDSVLRDVSGIGVVFGGGFLDVEGLVVRNLASGGDAKYPDRAIGVEGLAGDATKVRMVGSVIENVVGSGLSIRGAKAEVSGTRVTKVAPGTGSTPPTGMFVSAAPESKIAGSLTLRDSQIEQVPGIGLMLGGSDATVESLWVRALDAGATVARGIHVQSYTDPYIPGTLTLSRSLIEDVAGFGATVYHAAVTIDRCRVSRVRHAAEGGDGDGILVISDALLPKRAQLSLSRSLLESSARVGVSCFGCDAKLDHNAIDCATIDLDGEIVDTDRFDKPAPAKDFDFTDAGGNVCGCMGATRVCAAKSTKLLPPKVF